MRLISLFIIPIFLTNIFLLNSSGKYEYNTRWFHESIELLENQTFIYQRKEEFLNYKIKGNYHITGDSLVLDSYPQKEKIIVREKLEGEFENKTFYVTDKRGDLITFHLYLTLNDNSKKVFRDCFEKIEFTSDPIKSFSIVNTSGITTPEYKIEGKYTNTFIIQIETKRVFENEKWLLKNNKISPRGPDGKIQEYFLTKE